MRGDAKTHHHDHVPSAWPPPPQPGQRPTRWSVADHAGGTPSVFRRVAAHVARVVVPVECPGCGAVDVQWCEECAAQWWQQPLRSESSAGRLGLVGGSSLPVWAIASLEGSAHAMIAEWKDGGRRDLDRFFARRMSSAAADIAPQLVSASWLVVPVPARTASTARRGVDLPGLLAHAVSEGLRSCGVEAVVVPLLKAHGGDQRVQGARDRWRNAQGLALRHSVLRGLGAQRATPVLIVDDVVTTGASIAGAMRALEVEYLTVGAGLCLAATPRSGATAIT